MNLRVVSVDENQFQSAKEYLVWGSDKPALRSWKVGDLLAFKIGNEYASIVKVTQTQFYDDRVIWENGFFPYRVRLELIFDLPLNKRVPHGGVIKENFLKFYDKYYGYTMVNKMILKSELSEIIYSEFERIVQEVLIT